MVVNNLSAYTHTIKLKTKYNVRVWFDFSPNKAAFPENVITEDKMSLRTSASAPFIQNKLYLQYIFVIIL